MNRNTPAGIVVWMAVLIIPQRVFAGGIEYPASGTQGLGRGGANLTRADNPRIMVYNPALLADLWRSQIYMSANSGIADACFQPTGGYGWGYTGEDDVVVLDEDQGPLVFSRDYFHEPYPKVCYEGSFIFSSSLGLTTKLSDKLGIGLGIMPPEYSSMEQWGNKEGTIEITNQKGETLQVPNPNRYAGRTQNLTYFGLLGALGYRLLPWLRIGAGFRWSMIIVNIYEFVATGNHRNPSRDVHKEFLGKDLFIPGFTASVHAVPVDELDIAVGFRWEDRIRTNTNKAKMIHAGWALGEPYSLDDENGVEHLLGSQIPSSSRIRMRLENPPISVPQLSLGIRYGHRIKPRDYDTAEMKRWGDPIQDAMSTEYWDIELNTIYFFTSTNDQQTIYYPGTPSIVQRSVKADGTIDETDTYLFGVCPKKQKNGACDQARQTKIPLGGKDQLSIRMGSDINIFPGLFTVRAGISYEQRGLNPDYAYTRNYPLFESLGLHTGITIRFDGRTDISLSYAHFFKETIEVEPPAGALPNGLPSWMRAEPEKYHVVEKGDGVAKVVNGEPERPRRIINAGIHRWALDVVSASIGHHF